MFTNFTNSYNELALQVTYNRTLQTVSNSCQYKNIELHDSHSHCIQHTYINIYITYIYIT